MDSKQTEKRDENGRYLPGSSGNSRGRPLGSRNRGSRAAEALLDAQAEALTDRVIKLAFEGSPLALKLCLDRLLPTRRERHLVLDLPSPANAEDITAGFARVVEALTAGDLTPSETVSLAALLESARRALETTELARRIGELEERVGEGEKEWR